MRHFIVEVSLLAGGVVVPAALGLLVFNTGSVQGIPSSQRCACFAVLIAMVALLADAHLRATPSTVEQAIRFLHHHGQRQ